MTRFPRLRSLSMTNPPPSSHGSASSGRSSEQHAAVRRRALPVAIAAVICGIVGVVLPLTIQITAFTPPNIIAMNLAFCAMLMGVGILFYAKDTPGTRVARVFCLATILLGMVGMFIYTKQSVDSRRIRE